MDKKNIWNTGRSVRNSPVSNNIITLIYIGVGIIIQWESGISPEELINYLIYVVDMYFIR